MSEDQSHAHCQPAKDLAALRADLMKLKQDAERFIKEHQQAEAACVDNLAASEYYAGQAAGARYVTYKLRALLAGPEKE